ncbi:unnamed protein product, partial [Musa textilis]
HFSTPTRTEAPEDCAMDCCPELRKRRSCACPPLHIGNWCNGRRGTAGFARATADDCDEEFDSPLSCRPTQSRWRGLWRRIVKQKRRTLSSANPAHLPYDPYTYAQNFDEGSASVEPDNLSRSFSARFAVPSTTTTTTVQRVG